MTVIARTSRLDDFNLTGAGLPSIIARFFRALGAAYAAGREFERLDGRTDAQLARDGLSRETLSRAIFDRHFA